MEKELLNYRAYARYVRRLALFGGLFPRAVSSNVFLYRSLLPLAISFSIFTFYGIFNFCHVNIRDIRLLTKGLGMLGSSVIISLKAFQFLIYQKQIHELNGILDTLFEDILKDPCLNRVALSQLNLFRYPAYFSSSLAATAITSFLLKPFLIILHDKITNIHSGDYSLPYPVKFPWEFNAPGPIYQLHYIFFVLFDWFAIFVTIGVDALFNLYTFQISTILRVSAFECNNISKTHSEFNKALRKCVERHILLLRCRDIIENVYSPIILCLSTTGAIILCTLIFQALETGELTVMKVVMQIAYGLMKMMQTLTYAFYGNIIITEGEAFQRMLYCSEWYNPGEISLMKSFLLVITQRPLILMAYRFFKISLDIFVTTINTTISYFLLLTTLNDDDKH